MHRKNKTSFQLPLVFMLVYLIGTLILYAFGPFAWITYHPVVFWTLNIIYIVMLVFGWQFGIKYIYTSKTEWSKIQEHRLVKSLTPFLIINLLYEIINLFRKFGYSSFNLNGLFNNIKYGFTNMGDSYNTYQSSINSLIGGQVIGGRIITLFNYIWEFVAFAIVLLGTYQFKKLKRFDKCILIFSYMIIITSYVSTGTNIGVFRLILAMVVFFVLKVIRGEQNINRVKFKNKKRWVIPVVIVALVIIIVLFDKIMKSRGGILIWESDIYNIGGIGINKDSIFFEMLPEGFHMLIVSVSGYLTQGYYGMSLCMKTDWVPTFGLGHSMNVVKLLSEYVSDYVKDRTYQYRIEEFGWEPDIRWHTMYSWFANDISFYGVILIMFFIGLLFAMAYKDSIKTNNPFAHLMVYYFVFMSFFIPCNNQVFQSSYVMLSFYVVLVLWLCTRGRKTLKIRA